MSEKATICGLNVIFWFPQKNLVLTFECQPLDCLPFVCHPCLFSCDSVGGYLSPRPCPCFSSPSALPNFNQVHAFRRSALEGSLPPNCATFPGNQQALLPSSNRARGSADSVCLRFQCYVQYSQIRPHTRPPTHTTPLHVTRFHSHLPPDHTTALHSHLCYGYKLPAPGCLWASPQSTLRME